MWRLSSVIIILLLTPIYQVYGIQEGSAYLSLSVPISYGGISEAGHFANFYQTQKLQKDVISGTIKKDQAAILAELQKQIDEETTSMDSALKTKLNTAIAAAKKAIETDQPSSYPDLVAELVVGKFATTLEKELDKDPAITTANKTTINTAISSAITDIKTQINLQQGQDGSSACYFQMFCPAGFLKDIWYIFFTDKGLAKEKVKFERNFGVNAGIGYAISDYIRVELEAGMQRVDLNKIKYKNTSDDASSSQDSKSSKDKKKELMFNTASLMANSYFNLENDSNFVPYVGAGAGITTGGINEFKIKSFGIAYQGMAGLDVNLLEEFVGFIEYQYFGVYNFKINSYRAKSDDGDADKDTETSDSTGSLRFNYQSHAVKIGIKFLF
jgi:opacity protein-like surface antigen